MLLVSEVPGGCYFQFEAKLSLQSKAQACLADFKKRNTSMLLSNDTNEEREELVSYNKYKQLSCLNEFKSNIKTRVPNNCPCRLC